MPLNETKAQLKVSLNEILRKFHKGRQGNSLKTSSAKYVLSSVPDTGSLATTLAVYDEWIASKKSGQKITKAQIGINMRLVKEYIPLSTDRPAEVTSKKNKMSAMVSRYISNAEAIISNTVLGKFPDNSRPKAAKELSHVNAPKMDIYRYWLKRKVEDPKISMADIGFELKLKESWIPNKNDTAEIIKIKRNKMNSTVSRYIKNAKSFQDNKEHAKQA